MNYTKYLLLVMITVSIVHMYAMKSGLDVLFFQAASDGDVARLEERLKSGVDINARKPHGGETALHAAVEYRKVDTVNALLKHNADVSISNYGNPPKTAIDLAIDGYRRDDYLAEQKEALKATFLAIIDLFFNNNTKVDSKFLRQLVLRQKPGIINSLNVQKANPNAQSRGKNPITPLPYVIKYFSPPEALEIAKLLLEKGANPDKQDDDGLTALYWAIWRKNQELVELLLAHKANPNLAQNNGATPLHAALVNLDDVVMVDMLLKAGANPNVKDYYQATPLHTAAKNGNTAAVLLLLQAKADPNAQDADKYTPLGNAVQRDFNKVEPELVKALLAQGADPNIPSGKQTPLEIAQQRSSVFKTQRWIDVVEVLTAAGAQLSSGAAVTVSTKPIKSVPPKLTQLVGEPGEQIQPTGDGGLVEALNELARTLNVLENSLKI